MDRITPRKAIVVRRDEANTCVRNELYTAAALSACSGVELLLESLFTEYYISLLRDDRQSAKEFLNEKESWNIKNDLRNQWSIANWRRYFEKFHIPNKMQKRFGNEIKVLHSDTLKNINKEWNRCKHDIYVASPKIAIHIVEILNNALDELDFLAGAGSNQKDSVAELNKSWQDHWGAKISDWTAKKQNTPVSEVLSRLTSLLNLVVKLASDPRTDFEHKTSLLVAAHYVYSAIDLIPDVENNVKTLVDDGAVLVMTMSWLIKHENLDSELVNEHWSGKDDAIKEIQTLENYINSNHQALFPARLRASGTIDVWPKIRRVAEKGPETLWQDRLVVN